MRLIKISASKSVSLCAMPFNHGKCGANCDELTKEWDGVMRSVSKGLEKIGVLGNENPDGDFDVNPYYSARPGEVFSRYIDVCVISERGAYKDLLTPLHAILMGLKKPYRIGISPQIVGWNILFAVYLERDQAQVWCPNKTYFERLLKTIHNL